MKRKIVHLVYSLGYGGLEQVIVNLINNSTEIDVEHYIITLTAEQELYDAIIPEVPIYCLQKKPGQDFLTHWRLFKLLRQIKPDVINTYNFGTIEYHPVAALVKVKLQIHSEHGRGEDDLDGMNFWHNVSRRIALVFIDKFIVVSPDLLAWGKKVLKINEGKIRLIYNGVNLDEYYPPKASHPGFTICTVGRANPVKNQKLLIEAFYLLIQKHAEFKECKLIVVGGGSILDDLKSQTNELGIQEQVKLLGYRKDVANIMREANLFVLSSLYEAMPMTVLEAMACGLPVIATNVGGVGHMISDQEAWLVESNNAANLADTIFIAYQDKELSDTKAMLGRQLVAEKYSIDTMVLEYMRLYGVTASKAN